MASENDQVERAVRSLTRGFPANSKTSINSPSLFESYSSDNQPRKSRVRLDMPVTASDHMYRDDDLHPTDIILHTTVPWKRAEVQTSRYRQY